MKFAFSPEQDAFRAEVESFVAQNWAARDDRGDLIDHDEGWRALLAFRKQLAARGWLTLAWPEDWGGLGASPVQQAVYNEVMGYHGAPSMDMGADRVGPTIMLVGSEQQKRDFLPPIISAEANWCQGFSEPNAGSDLAGLATRAIADGDDFVIDGQKIWTSNAHRAEWMMLLARTDPEAPKHRGISAFLLPMSLPGITIRPLENMLGAHHFNEVFFESVRVPRSFLLGEKDRGWYVAATTLDLERSGIGRIAPGKRVLEQATEALRGRLHETDRHQLAELWIEYNVGRSISYRVAWLQQQGRIPNYEASISKAFGSEFQQRLARFALAVHGLAAQRMDSGHSRWARYYLGTMSLTIAGGTSEIQRNIVATRGLGLPRG